MMVISDGNNDHGDQPRSQGFSLFPFSPPTFKGKALGTRLHGDDDDNNDMIIFLLPCLRTCTYGSL